MNHNGYPSAPRPGDDGFDPVTGFDGSIDPSGGWDSLDPASTSGSSDPWGSSGVPLVRAPHRRRRPPEGFHDISDLDPPDPDELSSDPNPFPGRSEDGAPPRDPRHPQARRMNAREHTDSGEEDDPGKAHRVARVGSLAVRVAVVAPLKLTWKMTRAVAKPVWNETVRKLPSVVLMPAWHRGERSRLPLVRNRLGFLTVSDAIGRRRALAQDAQAADDDRIHQARMVAIRARNTWGERPMNDAELAASTERPPAGGLEDFEEEHEVEVLVTPDGRERARLHRFRAARRSRGSGTPTPGPGAPKAGRHRHRA